MIRALGRPAEAREDYERAIAIHEKLVKENPNPWYRSLLAHSLRRRGLALRELGDVSRRGGRYTAGAGPLRRARVAVGRGAVRDGLLPRGARGPGRARRSGRVGRRGEGRGGPGDGSAKKGRRQRLPERRRLPDRVGARARFASGRISRNCSRSWRKGLRRSRGSRSDRGPLFRRSMVCQGRSSAGAYRTRFDPHRDEGPPRRSCVTGLGWALGGNTRELALVAAIERGTTRAIMHEHEVLRCPQRSGRVQVLGQADHLFDRGTVCVGQYPQAIKTDPALHEVRVKVLRTLAKEPSAKTYCLYRKFRLGAAVPRTSGATYSRCNLEKASCSVAICAGRNAISSMLIADETVITAIVVYSPTDVSAAPCGNFSGR